MAGGGQKGVGGIEATIVITLALGFIGGCTARGWVDGNVEGNKAEQVEADFNADCATADADKRAGEEFNATLWNDGKCQAFLRWQDTQTQIDRAEEVQEANR